MGVLPISCVDTRKIRFFFFFSSRRRHTRYWRDWSSDVCSSDLENPKNFVRNGKSVGELKGFSCQLVADEAIRWLGGRGDRRSEERRVGKECRSRWSPYH